MRHLKNWLESYLKYTDPTEPPVNFHRWVGLFVLSSVTERKIFMHRGHYSLYPNLYIILLSKSALCRKSTAIEDLGFDMLSHLQPPIKNFGDMLTGSSLLSYGQETNAKIVIGASEMTTLLSNIYKTNLNPVLTQIYNSSSFRGVTITRGVEEIRAIYVTIIGGTTPEALSQVIPPEQAGGGLASRFIIVHEERPHRCEAYPIMDMELKAKLISDLQHIRSLEGEFKFSEEGLRWFRDWYEKHWNYVEQLHTTAISMGYFARKHDTLLKVAMLYSLSKKDRLVLDVEDLEDAKTAFELIEQKLLTAHSLMGATEKGLGYDRVTSIIRSAGIISHSELLRKVCYHYDADDVKKILATLVESKVIQVITEKTATKGRLVYKWVGGEEVC